MHTSFQNKMFLCGMAGGDDVKLWEVATVGKRGYGISRSGKTGCFQISGIVSAVLSALCFIFVCWQLCTVCWNVIIRV